MTDDRPALTSELKIWLTHLAERSNLDDFVPQILDATWLTNVLQMDPELPMVVGGSRFARDVDMPLGRWVSDWELRRVDYDCATNECLSLPCTAFTQLIAERASQVGCALQRCDSAASSSRSRMRPDRSLRLVNLARLLAAVLVPRLLPRAHRL